MEFNELKFKNLSEIELSRTVAGGRQAGELFLSGAYGAAQGISACASAGAYVLPQTLAVCGVVGAGLNIAFPH